MRNLYNRLNVKTGSFEFSTGSSGIIINSSDMQAVLASVEARPITWCHFLAFHQLGDTEQSLLHFKKHLIEYMDNQFLFNKYYFKCKTLRRYHGSAEQGFIDITNCVFNYTTRHKVKDDRIRAYMVDTVKADTFRRHYRAFLNDVVGKLETALSDLEYSIFNKINEKNLHLRG